MGMKENRVYEDSLKEGVFLGSIVVIEDGRVGLWSKCYELCSGSFVQLGSY